jgi:hypothetical protein
MDALTLQVMHHARRERAAEAISFHTTRVSPVHNLQPLGPQDARWPPRTVSG